MMILKHFHIAFAVITALGFVLRNVLRSRESPLLKGRWARTLPHVNDTLLFGTGVTMLLIYRWWPFDLQWLGVKLVAVLAYIVLGAFALRGPTPGIRTVALAAALLTLAYIFFLALYKRPLPLFMY